MTKKIVFDSFALISVFEEEKGHERVTHLLAEIAEEKHDGFLSVVNLGEVYYMLFRKRGKERAELALHSVFQMPLEIINADVALTYEAAKLKANYKMSYADAFAGALTIAKKGTLITGDKEFKHLAGETNFKVEFI